MNEHDIEYNADRLLRLFQSWQGIIAGWTGSDDPADWMLIIVRAIEKWSCIAKVKIEWPKRTSRDS